MSSPWLGTIRWYQKVITPFRRSDSDLGDPQFPSATAHFGKGGHLYGHFRGLCFRTSIEKWFNRTFKNYQFPAKYHLFHTGWA